VVFRNVIVCRIVPGSEQKVADVFGHFDKVTRPQDVGVTGRILLSLDDLYIHIVERAQDPEISGQKRGLPAFQEIAEQIAPFVTPYPRNWENPSHSVAKEFYSWVADPQPASAGANPLLIVQRIKPGSEPEVARVFAESDNGPLPAQMGVASRHLYSIDDVYVHLMERSDAAVAEGLGSNHHAPAFTKIIEDLSPYVAPYKPETWRGPQDSVAKPFYSWQASD
jgi:cyclase